MNILVITQSLDTKDQTLGFFHGWVKRMAGIFSHVEVIVLGIGEHDLPNNVSVHSLGKESGVPTLTYLIRFFSYIWKYRHHYDAVFVHMNQEYILLGGLLWKLLGKKIYFWRNHPRGSVLTSLSVLFSDRVFCTSKDSFTYRFKKTVMMPVGVDTDIFHKDSTAIKKKHSVCMVGRIAPVKHIELCVKAISILISEGIQISLAVIGPCYEKDMPYLNYLKEYVLKHNLSSYVTFQNGVWLEHLPQIYNMYDIIVNLTDSGSFDKTLVEGVACGAIPLVSNASLFDMLPTVCSTKNNPNDIAHGLSRLIQSDIGLHMRSDLDMFIRKNSLDMLIQEFSKYIT